jgi:hypothetical protein
MYYIYNYYTTLPRNGNKSGVFFEPFVKRGSERVEEYECPGGKSEARH